jgi:hypothetical protein
MSQPSERVPESPAMTALETPEQIRRALEARNARGPVPAVEAPAEPPPAPAGATPPPQVKPRVRPRGAAAYRPMSRPPVALLTVCDDGRADGEVIRIRKERFVVGRTEGDFLLPHDGLVSARHVEIVRHQVSDGWRFTVADLQTTNGLFVRISRTVLIGGAEFLVGRGRYRFESPETQTPVDAERHPEPGTGQTRPWGTDNARSRPPVLVELHAGGSAARFPLVANEHWIGRDPSCTVCRADDPFVEARHVRLSRAVGGAWEARNNKAPNGLWLRVPQIAVDGICLFQIGEQRFRLAAGA